MSTMLAAVFTGLEQMELREMPMPALEDDESLLLKVHACGLCGSDLRTLRRGHHRVTLPWIIGHEVSGTVAETGPPSRGGGFLNSSPPPGERG